MLPSKLMMQAFSTYLEPTTIDFTTLNEKGLYLISGDTGAGKTTIFDAICYALYGETSGNRSSDVFRSSYASFDIPTIVELDFILRETHYIVHREIRYSRNGNARPGSEFLRTQDTLIEGRTHVNEAIKKLLGVDSKQFKQIVMIAQGEFTKMLHVTSDERVKIFRSLFHTGNLVEFEEMLKKKSKEYEEEYQTSITKLNTLMTHLDMDLGDTFTSESLDSMEEELQRRKRIVNTEKKKRQERAALDEEKTRVYYDLEMMNQNIIRLDTYRKKQEELLSKEDIYDELSKEIDSLEQAKNLSVEEKTINKQTHEENSLSMTLRDLDLEEAALKERRKVLEKEEARENFYTHEISALSINIVKAQEQLEKKKDLEKYEKERINLERQVARRKDKLENSISSEKRLSDRIERDSHTVEQLQDMKIKMKEMDDRVNQTIDRRIKLHDLSDANDAYKEAEERHYELTNQYDRLRKRYDKAFKRYKDVYDHYMSQQAGILASTLEEGEPCPVCGALHHPSPAKLIGKSVSGKDVNDLETEANRIKEEMDVAYETLTTQQIEKNEIAYRISLLSKELDIQEELSKQLFIRLLADVTVVEQEASRQYREMQGQVGYLENLSRSVKRDKESLKTITKNVEQARSDLQTAENNLAAMESTIKAIRKHYPDIESITRESIKQEEKRLQGLKDNLEAVKNERDALNTQETIVKTRRTEASARLTQVRQEIKTFTENFEAKVLSIFESISMYHETLKNVGLLADKRKEYISYIDQVRMVKEIITELEPIVGNHKLQDLTELKAELEAFKQDKKEKDEAASAISFAYDQDKKTVRSIKKAARENEKLFKDYELYHHLNAITSGRNAQKLSFERYVLASYFEHILDYANVELERLSQGRFQFLRRTTVKGNAGQGLDLNVLDFETGVSRDVRSLSGGESFKASLALALGMSEMIQNMAGGIELNALFIDEGFGSLDDESLDQAINVLMDMKDDNKVISIISHVNELKNRIDSGIVVSRGDRGSTLKII